MPDEEFDTPTILKGIDPETSKQMLAMMVERNSRLIRTLADMWEANDPAHSESGSEYGLARRAGRRDVCEVTIAALLGGANSAHVRKTLEEGGFR